MTLDHPVEKVSDLPFWNYDGSSTKQAVTKNSEVIIKPVAFFPDPFRGGDNILVMTSTYKFDEESKQEEGEETKLVPANTNFRHFAEKTFELVKEHEPWFGIEQEYTLFEQHDPFTKWPLGWPKNGYPVAQGPYYCSVGATSCFGRIVMDSHYKACLAARIQISGTNGEVMPGQWEYQIGPCEGISIGDHLWMSRYILGRITEDLNIGVSFEPKPIKGKDWNGAGCHTNYSTKVMREEGGIDYIEKAIKCLEENHALHMELYGEGNKDRLKGFCETGKFDKFSHGVGDRGASVRIPIMTKNEGRGYMEDRRPASNIDPYVVGSLLVSTTILAGKEVDELHKHYTDWLDEKKALES